MTIRIRLLTSKKKISDKKTKTKGKQDLNFSHKTKTKISEKKSDDYTKNYHSFKSTFQVFLKQ